LIPTNNFTTYRKPDWDSSRPSIPLPKSFHITTLVDAILAHNKNNEFTGVNFIGESGTGKSTIMASLIHRIHQKKEYAIHWFSDYDMTRLVEILNSMPQVPWNRISF